MTFTWLRREPIAGRALPISVRMAMAAVSEIEGVPDRSTVAGVLAAFQLSPALAAAWWDQPSSWIANQRPAKLMHRGEGIHLLMAVTAAALEAVVQMRVQFGDAEAAHGAGVMAQRMLDAGAPPPVIQAIQAAAASGSNLRKDLADGV